MFKLKFETLFLLGSTLIGLVVYFNTTFAAVSRVQSLEVQIENIQKVVCAIAIEQRLSKVEDICMRTLR